MNSKDSLFRSSIIIPLVSIWFISVSAIAAFAMRKKLLENEQRNTTIEQGLIKQNQEAEDEVDTLVDVLCEPTLSGISLKRMLVHQYLKQPLVKS